ncbi:MAG: acetate--CoA ligase family protein [Clostridiales Family XIII bacterium]|nr:acetate--CoA ligase family protein [Clostridiales Family XIII bacterium]
MDIKYLLKPNAVCVIGASEKEGFGGDTCRNIIRYMEPDTYFFINPKRDSVFGTKCYPSVADLPQQVDLAVICTPKAAIEDMLRDAHTAGCKAAVIYASGYAEMGTEEGRKAQENLAALAKRLDMPICGPNCAGLVNYVDDKFAFAFIAPDRDRRGSVGFVSQSGQICLTLMENPASKFSYSISSGNSAVVQMEDYIDFLVDDADTKVVAVYLEGSKNPAKLVAALKRAAINRKPVVVLKTGRSAKGMNLASSHTGSMAGADKVYDALFRKFGVIRVNDVEELLAASMMFATFDKLPETPAFAAMNLSGGEAGTSADVGELYGIDFPDFSDETLARLREQLPPYASPANPLDMTASLSYEEELFAEALRTVMRDPGVGCVCVGYTLLQEIADPAIHYMGKAMAKVAGEPGAKPQVMIPFVENTRNEEYFELLAGHGIPIMPPTMYAYRILSYLADFIAYDPEGHDLDIAVPGEAWKMGKTAAGDAVKADRADAAYSAGKKADSSGKSATSSSGKADAADSTGKSATSSAGKADTAGSAGSAGKADTAGSVDSAGQRVCTEYESRVLLAEHGFPPPVGGVAKTCEEALEIASHIGYPVAMKVSSWDILHKSDVGGVALGIGDEAGVVEAWQKILANCKEKKPDADIDGIFVTEMAAKGAEMILGVICDPEFGPCVLCGMGGVYVEIFKDTALCPAPVSRAEARSMIDSLKSARLLKGYRGSVPIDVEALVDGIVSVSDFAIAHRDSLQELDINPIFVHEKGFVPADALVIMR